MTKSSSNAENVQERSVRTRYVHVYGLVTYDNSVRFTGGMKEVSIEDMMAENPERKKAVMYIQLIHIVYGSNNSQNNMTSYQSYYKNNKKETSSSHYYRLLLFRDVSCKSGRVVYVVEGGNMNDMIWNIFPQLRDNGVVSIGSYICVINPLPITKFFSNDIHILEVCT